MNKILKLFDEQYVIDLLKREALPKLPEFLDIKKVNIQPFKENIWKDTYHVIIKFETYFLALDKTIKKILIYCTAHSDEPRENVYKVLSFLWDNNFPNNNLVIPRPLFYSRYFRGTFYIGLKGNNLYSYIKTKNLAEIKKIIPLAAAWFAKLHNLPVKNAKNFNKENSRIETVIPGQKHILKQIKINYPSYFNIYQKAYNYFVKEEENFLSSTKERWLIHGDAHPENIIKISGTKLGLIDFTDICLSDFARDLGCFLWQFEFMVDRKIGNKKFSDEIKNLFLENYFKDVKMKLDGALKERINNYSNWTAIRTATFFLIKDKAEPERAEALIKKIENKI